MSETARERRERHGKAFHDADRFHFGSWETMHPVIRERAIDDAEELFERWAQEVVADAQAAVNRLGARMASGRSLDDTRDQEAIGDVLAALETLRGEASHGN